MRPLESLAQTPFLAPGVASGIQEPVPPRAHGTARESLGTGS